jgi:hypothetical protein
MSCLRSLWVQFRFIRERGFRDKCSISFQHASACKKVGPVELRYIETNNPSDDAIRFCDHYNQPCQPACPGHHMAWSISTSSCEAFEVAEVVAFACRMFQTKDVEVHAVERATRSRAFQRGGQCNQWRVEYELVAGLHFVEHDPVCNPLLGGQGGLVVRPDCLSFFEMTSLVPVAFCLILFSWKI